MLQTPRCWPWLAALAVLWMAEGQTIARVSQIVRLKPNQGRVNAIAVDPRDALRVLVTTESGGVFESRDGGRSFGHRDDLPILFGADIAFSPSLPGVVVATGLRDFTKEAGIWVSVDRGRTFTHPAAAVAATGPYCLERPNAGSISFARPGGRIYVATDCGVAMAEADGSGWKTVAIPRLKGEDNAFLAIAAVDENRVVIGGRPGLLFSKDYGKTWTKATGGPERVVDLHALAVNPVSNTEVYAMGESDGVVTLFASHDRGETWEAEHRFGKSGGCGGISFVRVADVRPRVNLSASDRCGTWVLTTQAGSNGVWDYTGQWTAYTSQHADHRDIAFSAGGIARFLASDGGFQAATTALDFKWTAAPAAGLDALQVTELAGQGVPLQVYYGTQDNDVGTGIAPLFDAATQCCEGFFFSAEPDNRAPNRITYTACGDCVNYISDPGLKDAAPWPNPQKGQSTPKMVGLGTYLQPADALAGATGVRMMYTSDEGRTWTEAAKIPEELRGFPATVINATEQRVYQPVRTGATRTGAEIVTLARLDGTRWGRQPNFALRYPAMKGFGSLGGVATMFVWYRSLAIDPRDPLHLIAADVQGGTMKITWDGGENWDADFKLELTTLATHSGALKFSEPSGTWTKSLISAIGFCPGNNKLVLAAATNGGAYLSTTRGWSWSAVPGSERITYPTSVIWEKSCQTAYLSTYGRGIWRIDITQIKPQPRSPRPGSDVLSKNENAQDTAQEGVGTTVRVETNEKSAGLAFAVSRAAVTVLVEGAPETALLDVDGTIRGPGVTQDGALRFLVRPPRNGWATGVHRVIVRQSRTDSTELAATGFRTAPALPLVNAATGSPTSGKPYVQVLSRQNLGGTATLRPGEALVVIVRAAPRGAVIVVDGQAYERTSNQEGLARFEIPAPRDNWVLGVHRVVLQSGRRGGTVLDATGFNVPAQDDPPQR